LHQGKKWKNAPKEMHQGKARTSKGLHPKKSGKHPQKDCAEENNSHQKPESKK
jgi:hypothetical protein